MTKSIIFYLFLFFIYFLNTVYSANRNILFNEFKAKNGIKGLMNINEWRTKLIDRIDQELQQVPVTIKEDLIRVADRLNMNQTLWSPLEVIQYLDFVKIGNEVRYEKSVSNRRIYLEKLVMAQLFTNNAKYMNQIANGLWLTLEESTWVYPALLYLQKAGSGLPDSEELVIDLYAPEAANQVSYIRLLLGIYR